MTSEVLVYTLLQPTCKEQRDNGGSRSWPKAGMKVVLTSQRAREAYLCFHATHKQQRNADLTVEIALICPVWSIVSPGAMLAPAAPAVGTPGAPGFPGAVARTLGIKEASGVPGISF
ncbi:hypothetical protein EYF80_002038 [Liparis tanakae]|uniref:Uncharacterized protein n=1 Tax=Liparis tanakae TaxID=230148 RepID=A0A4Z2JCF1_9TELE|nr:hypothetical protein EYF80_002038 [Liparis tanakae]